MSGRIVVMGVSGCGKSTLAQGLADALGWTFIEGDLLHPPENVARMAAGIALDDAARHPFLCNVADALRAAPAGAVAACSALKRSYRDLVRARAGEVVFVLPTVTRQTLAARMEQRSDHFMPASLLNSQLATLELPGSDEDAVTVDGDLSVAAQVAAVLRARSWTRGSYAA
ncbi:gluconokinase [Sphingomonas baiyangensis]|uniref:Gluconokinase n=1 Tax=Sphingomonas baiyangensis TaxID=2572576 RepID=A0A4U1L4L2_9SPHN|nr:gluconokinase [Sphingomonas baiyangensis]TKD51190.1 gluconokinase [Sphingomonas baiyangensis]